MLTMSRSCNASEQGSWKDSYRSTADSVESFEDSVDSDNSSTSSSQASARQSGANIQPPIGCITTHSVSAVIRPEKKMPPIDPLQFVKIQKNELSKKAVEQIKLAEEVKITKEKIKEVEEEWQNNLMSWKSKRKLTKNNSEDESQLSRNTNRKTKTFTEILNEKARSGGRIGYNLHRYAAVEDEEADFRSAQKEYMQQYETSPVNSDSNPEDEMTLDQLSFDATESNLNRLLKPNANAESFNDEDEICRNGLGEVVVYDTTLLEEFSVNKSDGCEIEQTNGASADNRNDDIFNIGNTQQVIIPSLDSFESAQIHYQYQPEPSQNALSHESPREMAVPSVEDKNSAHLQSIPQKVHVPINDWKSNHPKHPKQAVPSSDDDTPPQQPLHNSSFEVEDEEEELDEELERLRLDQERSFKAKLYAFENLAKQEEEAARKATESYRRRQQSRAKLAAERSRSLGNIQQSSSQGKVPVTTSYSISSSSIPVSQAATSTESSRTTKAQFEKQSKSMQNLNSEMPVSSISINPAVSNSTIYNFTNKDVTKSLDLDSLSAHSELSETKSNSSINSIQPKSQIKQVESVPKSSPPVSQISISTSQTTQQQQQAQNIYENITPLGLPQQSQLSPVDPVSDSNAIRNASQKLLQQQQQIYQNQPLPVQYQQQPPQLYPPEHYSTVPTSANFGYQYEHANMQSHHVPSMPADHPVQPTDNILNDKVINPVPIRGYAISDEVGLPPVQITKSNQSGSNKAPFTKAASLPVAAIPEEEHLYVNQNQLMLNPTAPNLNQNFPPFEYHQNTPGYESYNNVNVHFHEPNYENQTLIQKRMEDVANGIYQPDQYSNQLVHPQQQQQYPNAPNQYLYYPKPYSAANSTVKPIQAKQPQIVPNVSNLPRAVPNSQNVRYAQNNGSNGHRVAYNQNHWLLQEAELRRQLDSMESSSQRLKNPNAVQQPQPKSGGYLSVSGKKKCSSCMDELGKGCAAMVVESLSLYYHINCFRCSVCNVQLGNGTVGTDVRVRNNKLHCQNCYSNDEAGLKFSRV